MRKIVALLLVLLLMMTVPVMAYAFRTPSQGTPGDSGGDDPGSHPVESRKDFTAPTAGLGETTEATETTTATEAAEETTVPETETVAETTVPTEETAATTEPVVTSEETKPSAPVDNQQKIESVIGQKTEQTVEPAAKDSGTESFLLSALIAGLGAICGVLVIRRILDL